MQDQRLLPVERDDRTGLIDFDRDRSGRRLVLEDHAPEQKATQAQRDQNGHPGCAPD